ncbi:hypothetical protein [Catalinimonas niigatensis]|uniref:hypothetical protein n=1 Tax=Catalinimonas niigatensis TaxID=1397264 RepID=UPI0026663F32|nr:hypothetical protein [Catalinimonas niigatensis]WPP48924.1 hypothetical protein PZB72_19855 [Catalinimonas niigatensis]
MLRDPDFDLNIIHKEKIIEVDPYDLLVHSDYGLSVEKKSYNNRYATYYKITSGGVFGGDELTRKDIFGEFDSQDKSTFILDDIVLSKIANLSDKISVSNYFERISGLPNVRWTKANINQYKNYWNWYILSSNQSIEWDVDKINKFSDLINFKSLSYNSNAWLTKDVIKKHIDKWDWNALSSNPAVAKHTGIIFLEDFSEHIIWKGKETTQDVNYKPELVKKNFGLPVYECPKGYSDLKPSVSSNSGFEWNHLLFKKHGHKMDMWTFAYFGKIDNEILYDSSFYEKLYENRRYGIIYHKHSDYKDEEELIFRNGWENLLLNENIILDKKFFEWGGHGHRKVTTKIIYDGTNKESTVFVKDLRINPNLLKLGFSDFMGFSPKYLINENEVDITVWLNILKPEFIRRPELIKGIIQCAFKNKQNFSKSRHYKIY